MGRPRSFDEQGVIAAAAGAFTDLGYEATSVDDLLRATGLHRGSLYQAFGSKRGLFLATLRAHLPDGASPGPTEHGASDAVATDLLLVATLELAPRDEEVRAVVARALRQRAGPDGAALALGRRLLARARLDTDTTRWRDPPWTPSSPPPPTPSSSNPPDWPGCGRPPAG